MHIALLIDLRTAVAAHCSFLKSKQVVFLHAAPVSPMLWRGIAFTWQSGAVPSMVGPCALQLVNDSPHVGKVFCQTCVQVFLHACARVACTHQFCAERGVRKVHIFCFLFSVTISWQSRKLWEGSCLGVVFLHLFDITISFCCT